MNDLIQQMSGISQENLKIKLQEFFKEANLQLQDEVDNLDQDADLILLQGLFGTPKKKFRGRLPTKIIKDSLLVRMFKKGLMLLGRILCATIFKNLGRNFKIYLLQQTLNKINSALRYLDKHGYIEGPIKDFLLNLKKRVEEIIGKEMGKSLEKVYKPKFEELTNNPRPTDRNNEATPKNKEAENNKTNATEKEKTWFDKLLSTSNDIVSAFNPQKQPDNIAKSPVNNLQQPSIFDKFTAGLFGNKNNEKLQRANELQNLKSLGNIENAKEHKNDQNQDKSLKNTKDLNSKTASEREKPVNGVDKNTQDSTTMPKNSSSGNRENLLDNLKNKKNNFQNTNHDSKNQINLNPNADPGLVKGPDRTPININGLNSKEKNGPDL